MTTSAVYEGWVAHRRAGEVPHSFGYRVFMPLFDLEELPGLLDAIPLWSARRPAPARFRDSDYLPGDGDSLAERARNLVDARLGRRPAGPVRLLANPRYLGVGFNPVSFLFLHTPDGGLDSVIAEVTNTPWGERTAYVLDWDGHGEDEPITCSFKKGMHVSPFQSMEQTYEISVTRPGQRLGVVIRNHEGGREVFVASMALRRSEVTRTRMLRLLFRYPPMTVATLARIYVNAVRLKLRGAPFHPRPEVRDEQALRVSEQARSRTRVIRAENTKGPLSRALG
ncbi:MAG: DUF1365 domain-containing protein [Solirubrobacterales bacterium]|jgi:uncharacterized protein